ncbi:rab11 family-interacting protein 4B isoform X7 [Contarinia nasturtii]|uniref:rab11 family-interacting protein 4B isoform X7 n=1 Tax=Contarinia nasturtii TaxID=265458 RepID=UPI0012D4AF8D|nr:rab11 family-interacting protein 4B isoform X7 [Contarinia nasturtii]
MTSASGVRATADIPNNSEPESLDSLAYDDWEGQFEFVGNNNNNNNSSVNDGTTPTPTTSDMVEDLNLTTPKHVNQSLQNFPILIDEETFLSMQSNNNDEPYSMLPEPDSHQLIENALKHLQFDNHVPSQNNKTNKRATHNDLEILQRQVSTLADSQSNAEDRTSRTKTEHAVLQARYHMLEDQLREVEIRAEERLNEEQKRHRELLARVEREAILQNENCQIKIRTIELETNNLREELQRLRTQYDKQTVELRTTTEKLEDVCDNLTLAREELTEAKENEKKYLAEKLAAEDLMIELGKEVERLRQECGPAMPTTSPETLRLEELHQEMEELRQAKKQLIEQNEELQAMVLTRGVEEGRNLLNGTSNSLAQEIDELNDRQDSVDSASTLASLTKLQAAYQEKEEENQRLKHYIDTILLNIVENYPQILEVKTNPMSNKR